MLRKDTLIAVLGSPIAYYAAFARVLGGVEEGIFVSQFFYWYGKGHDPEGWTYKTQDEIFDETGLTRRNQETARKQLRNLGVLEEKRAGIPARLYYRLNLDMLFSLVDQALTPDEPPPQISPIPPSPSASTAEEDAGQSAAPLVGTAASTKETEAVIEEKETDRGEPASVSSREKGAEEGAVFKDVSNEHPTMADSAILEKIDPIHDGSMIHTTMAESAIQKSTNPPSSDGGIRQILLYSTKTTTKTTSENTTNTTTIRVNPEAAGATNESVVVDVLADPARAWILESFQELLGEDREATKGDRAALVELAAFPEHLVRDAFDAARAWLQDPKRTPIHALGRWLVGTVKRKQEAEGRQGSRVKGQAQPGFDFDWEEYQAAMEERRQPTIVKPEDKLWQQVMDDLALQFPRSTMDAWLVDTWLISVEEGNYQVGTRTLQNRDWLQQRMAKHIQKTLSRVVGQKVQVEFQVAQTPSH